MKPLKIYLATPFTHDDPDVERQRYEEVTHVAGELMKLETQNLIIYSPITHSYPIHIKHKLPGDWEFWKKYDTAFLEWADQLWIWTKDDAWKTSTGVNKEMEIARELNKPIMLLEKWMKSGSIKAFPSDIVIDEPFILTPLTSYKEGEMK